jgi:hypothetical protein
VLILALTKRDDDAPVSAPLAASARAVLAVLTVVLGALAFTVWVDAWRDTVSRNAPADLIGLTGTYLGAWCSFGAALTGWAAVRGRWDDARLPLVAIAVVGGGLAVAFLRVLDDLRRPGAALAASVGLAVLAVVLYVANAPRATQERSAR